MKKIIAYLLVSVAADIAVIILLQTTVAPAEVLKLRLPLLCGVLGGLGGAIYCLRAVYLNACVLKTWDDTWQPWYYIRPIVSHLCGAVSFIFLKTGLLLLEAEQATDSTQYGFLALAFIAGLNVDKFVTKLEEIAQATWGIEKSRTAAAAKEQKDGK